MVAGAMSWLGRCELADQHIEGGFRALLPSGCRKGGSVVAGGEVEKSCEALAGGYQGDQGHYEG